MSTRFSFRPIPPDFVDRFPDGDYTVGRGADPRGRLAKSDVSDTAATVQSKKPRKPKRGKKALRPAAE